MTKVQCGVLGCECACHRAKVRKAPIVWTTGMDRVLAESLERGDHAEEIAARLHLTVDAIRWRIRQRNRSLREGWRSRQEATVALGVGRRAVDRWMQQGLLRFTPHGRRWTRIRESDLEAFVSTHAGLLFEPDGVADVRLRRMAETAALANRRRLMAI